MNRFWKEFLWIVIVLLIYIIQAALFINSDILNQLINPILFIAILLGVFGFLDRAFFVAVFGGYLLDLYSALPFGIIISSFILSVTVIHLLRQKVFKNDALHAFFINGLIATIFFHVFFCGIVVVASAGNIVNISNFDWLNYLVVAAIQTVIHMVIMVVVILFESVLQKKFVRV